MTYEYSYLIIGGGMTADAAVAGIREHDPSGTIGVISAEACPPYRRPPLSKKLWSGEPLSSIWLPTAARDATLHLGRTAVAIHREKKQVLDDVGQIFSYNTLLLATGVRPHRFPFDAPGVIYFRTLQDYWVLRLATEAPRTVAVIGGGFIGSELAASLTMAGCHVTMLFPGPRIGAGVFPADLGAFLNDYYRWKGVDVRPGSTVESITRDERGFHLLVNRAGSSMPETISAGRVVAGIGVRPNVELAEHSGLGVEDGILVDETLHTNDPSIFAAGDVARFPSAALGKLIRVEHEDNALTMGKEAGAAMTGASVRYIHQPYFYSDLFDLGYEAVGDLDPRLLVVSDWEERFRKGAVYYLRGERVVGALLWNLWGQVQAVRRMIAEGGAARLRSHARESVPA